MLYVIVFPGVFTKYLLVQWYKFTQVGTLLGKKGVKITKAIQMKKVSQTEVTENLSSICPHIYDRKY